MTDKELLQALEPLKEKMKIFDETNGGQLTATDVQLMKTLYPDLQERALGQLPKVFTASCSSCIREVFRVYTSWYLRNV